jgi:hypothetical protein
MGEVIGWLIGIFLVIAVVVVIIRSIVNVVIPFCTLVLLHCAQNLLAAADQLLGSWAFVPPYISWFVVVSVCVALLHFAVFEARKLFRPSVAPILIILSIAILTATPLAGPLLNQAMIKSTKSYVRHAILAATGKSARAEPSDTSVSPIPLGVYIRDSVKNTSSLNIGDYFEVLGKNNAVSSVGARGTFSKIGRKVRFVFTTSNCFEDNSGSHTEYIADTLLLKIKQNVLVNKNKSKWTLWKSGATIFDYNDSMMLWSTICPGQHAQGFVLSKAGTLTFNRIPLSRLIRPNEQVKISPLSPSRRYRVAMRWDGYQGGCEIHIVDMVRSRVVVRKSGLYGFQARCIWSPDEQFLLMERGGEGVCEVICFDLKMQSVSQVPFSDLTRTYCAGIRETQLNTLDSAEWVSPFVFKSKIKIFCNSYNDTSRYCTGSLEPRRIYWAFIDARNFSVRYENPIVFDTTDPCMKNIALSAVSDSIVIKEKSEQKYDLIGTWFGTFSDKPLTIIIESNDSSNINGYDKVKWNENLEPTEVPLRGTFDSVTGSIELQEQGEGFGIGKFTGKVSSEGNTISGTWTRIKGPEQTFEWTVMK